MERSQSPLAACSSTGPLERWTHVDGNGFYTAAGESWSMTSKTNAGGGRKDCVAWKVEEAVHYFEHADKVTTDSSRAREKSRSRWRTVSYGTWRSPFTNFKAKFWTLSSAWQSREKMGEDAYTACSGCGRINALYKGRKMQRVRVAKGRFWQKGIPQAFLIAFGRFFCLFVILIKFNNEGGEENFHFHNHHKYTNKQANP